MLRIKCTGRITVKSCQAPSAARSMDPDRVATILKFKANRLKLNSTHFRSAMSSGPIASNLWSSDFASPCCSARNRRAMDIC